MRQEVSKRSPLWKHLHPSLLARAFRAVSSVFSSQEPLHERAHQLTAGLRSHPEVQARGHDLPTPIQPRDRLVRPMVQDLSPCIRHSALMFSIF